MEFELGDSNLFGDENNGPDAADINIAGFKFSLTVAEDDFNANKRCLFATMIWSGAKVLADYLSSSAMREQLVGKSVVEFGAAAGLPSILCNKLSCSVVCASDYPSDAVIENLKQNIHRNRESNGVIDTVPHIWGESIDSILQLNSNHQYDFVLAAECLWHHTSHSALLTSIYEVLKPRGTLLVTFSHHVPGVEDRDLHFFTLAEQSGFKIVSKQSATAPHMWREKETIIYLYALVKH